MNIFLGLISVREFFSFNFPLREYFFCTLPLPPPPHKFSNGPSLNAHFYKYAKKVVYQLDFLKINLLHKSKMKSFKS